MPSTIDARSSLMEEVLPSRVAGRRQPSDLLRPPLNYESCAHHNASWTTRLLLERALPPTLLQRLSAAARRSPSPRAATLPRGTLERKRGRMSSGSRSRAQIVSAVRRLGRRVADRVPASADTRNPNDGFPPAVRDELRGRCRSTSSSVSVAAVLGYIAGNAHPRAHRREVMVVARHRGSFEEARKLGIGALHRGRHLRRHRLRLRHALPLGIRWRSPVCGSSRASSCSWSGSRSCATRPGRWSRSPSAKRVARSPSDFDPGLKSPISRPGRRWWRASPGSSWK